MDIGTLAFAILTLNCAMYALELGHRVWAGIWFTLCGINALLLVLEALA